MLALQRAGGLTAFEKAVQAITLGTHRLRMQRLQPVNGLFRCQIFCKCCPVLMSHLSAHCLIRLKCARSVTR